MKQRKAVMVLSLIDEYLPYAEARQRRRSYEETKRHLERHAAPLHHDRAEAVQRRDIAALLERVKDKSGPIAANRLRAALSALWSWGLRTGRLEGDANPVSFTMRNVEKARERTLTDEELERIWRATDEDGDYSRIVRLCMLTGCRREEIGGLRWNEIQEDWIVIAGDRMKRGRVHEVALLPLILATLPSKPEDAEGYVFGRRKTGFSGWSNSKAALDTQIAAAGFKVPGWGLHDLRRTFSTRLHDAGIEPLVIEALLAHKQQGVAAVYNRASFREAKRAALERWHELLKGVTR